MRERNEVDIPCYLLQFKTTQTKEELYDFRIVLYIITCAYCR